MQNSTGTMEYMKKCLLGAAIGLGTGVVLATIFSFIASFMGVDKIPVLSWIAVAVAGLAGGFATGRLTQQKGLLCGAICGLAIFVVFLVASLLMSWAFSVSGIFKAIVTVLLAAFGGVTGVNMSKIKHHHRRR